MDGLFELPRIAHDLQTDLDSLSRWLHQPGIAEPEEQIDGPEAKVSGPTIRRAQLYGAFEQLDRQPDPDGHQLHVDMTSALRAAIGWSGTDRVVQLRISRDDGACAIVPPDEPHRGEPIRNVSLWWGDKPPVRDPLSEDPP